MFVVVESLEWFVLLATSNQEVDSSFDLHSSAVVAFVVASASCCGGCCHSIVIDVEAIVGVVVKVTS